jgi:hypothetical protein
MPKTYKINKRNNKNRRNKRNKSNKITPFLFKNLKFKGGFREEQGFPACNNLTQIIMSDEQINNFQRDITSPMDCFINALQLFGVLDTRTANLMRISSLGKTGFQKEEIEMIFIYVTGKNFDFKATHDYSEFSSTIKQRLQPGHAVFAGYEGHVFIIARTQTGTILYIDPQVPIICNLAECEERFLTSRSTFYLLFNSDEAITVEQQKIVQMIASSSKTIAESIANEVSMTTEDDDL